MRPARASSRDRSSPRRARREAGPRRESCGRLRGQLRIPTRRERSPEPRSGCSSSGFSAYHAMSASGPLVVAALSGGVDSATAAALLVEQGHRVVGMTMRLYDARGTAASAGGRGCGPRDVADARAVCTHLGIPFYVVDLTSEFAAAVVDDFVEAYLSGETPNPCVKCNQHIKFTPLLARARAIGADVLVTGHYAQIVARDGAHELRRGVDASKD